MPGENPNFWVTKTDNSTTSTSTTGNSHSTSLQKVENFFKDNFPWIIIAVMATLLLTAVILLVLLYRNKRRAQKAKKPVLSFSLEEQEKIIKMAKEIENRKQSKAPEPKEKQITPTHRVDRTVSETQLSPPKTRHKPDCYGNIPIPYDAVKNVTVGGVAVVIPKTPSAILKQTDTEKVMAATEEKTGRAVIVKKTTANIDPQKKILQLLKANPHENIVNSEAWQTQTKKTARRLAMLTRRIPGKNAEEFARDDLQKMPVLARLALLRPIAFELISALQHLHQLNIVHADLKPANIMIENNHKPCLIDFGCSVIIAEDKELTYTPGDAGYLAPEVWESARAMYLHLYQGRVIIHNAAGQEIELGSVENNPFQEQRMTYNAIKRECWALGVTLCEMLLGKNPFVAGVNKTEEGLPAEFGRFVLEATPIFFENIMDLIKNTELFRQYAQHPLIQIIIGFLQVNPEERLTLEKAEKILNVAQPEVFRANTPHYSTMRHFGAPPTITTVPSRKINTMRSGGVKTDIDINEKITAFKEDFRLYLQPLLLQWIFANTLQSDGIYVTATSTTQEAANHGKAESSQEVLLGLSSLILRKIPGIAVKIAEESLVIQHEDINVVRAVYAVLEDTYREEYQAMQQMSVPTSF